MSVQTRSMIDLYEVARSLRGRKLLLLAAVGFGLSIGVLWAMFGSRTYEVRIIAAPVVSETNLTGSLGQVGNIASLIGLTPPGSVTRKDEAIATLTSRSFLYSFIRDLELLPVLFPRSEESSLKPGGGLDSREPTLQDAYELLRGVISINEQRGTGLVEISVRWTDPETPAHWGEELITRLNRDMQQKARVRAEQELEFLQKELHRTDILEVRQAIFRLIEAQLQTMMITNVADNYALRVIDPPIAPDIDRPVSLSAPARIVLGTLFGLFSGIGLALLLSIKHILRLPPPEERSAGA